MEKEQTGQLQLGRRRSAAVVAAGRGGEGGASLERLPSELVLMVADHLVYTERRALGATCRRLGRLTAASLNNLRLRFPDAQRASDLQLFHGLRLDSPRFLAALDYCLRKGAKIREVKLTGTVEHLHEAQKELPGLLCRLSGQRCAGLCKLWIDFGAEMWHPGLSFAEKMAIIESYPELTELRLQGFIYDATLTLASFAALTGFRHLRSIEIAVTSDAHLDFTELLRQLPLRQLQEVRISDWFGDDAANENLKAWVASWPCLPQMELLSFGKYDCPALSLPWDRLPNLRSLKGYFVLDHKNPPELASLQRLEWGYSYPGLIRFLGATTGLEELVLDLKDAPTPQLADAIASLSRTLTVLELSVSNNADAAPDAVPRLFTFLRRLPRVKHLRLFHGVGGPPWVSPADTTFAFCAAATLPAIRQLTVLRYAYQLILRDATDRPDELRAKMAANAAILVADVLGNAARAPGLGLKVTLTGEIEARALKAAVVALDPVAADLILFNWAFPATWRRD